MKNMRVNENLVSKMTCPLTKGKLSLSGKSFSPRGDSVLKYPIVDGVPILINESNSVFKVENFVNNEDTTWASGTSTFKKVLRKFTPAISHNIKAKQNFERLVELLPKNASILIVGGGVVGPGSKKLLDNTGFEVVVSDVSLTKEVDIIFDCHDISFEDATFDLVVVQSVLEHVLDPFRCVQEIHRVLVDGGIVYAETPFVQQVHMKEYDFMRFTHLGHRRLFRYFSEIDSGPTGGPGMSLAWAYRAFIRSFSDNVTVRSILTIFAHWTSFYLKYFDYLMIDKASAIDGASENYFIGRKELEPLTDHDLLNEFRGVRW